MSSRMTYSVLCLPLPTAFSTRASLQKTSSLLSHQIKHLLPDFLACLPDYPKHSSSSTSLAPAIFWPFPSSVLIIPSSIFISLSTKQRSIIYPLVHSLDNTLNILAVFYPPVILECKTTKPQWIWELTTPHIRENGTTMDPLPLTLLGLQCWTYTVHWLNHCFSLFQIFSMLLKFPFRLALNLILFPS